jgi:NADH dehydrogenase FAD-containing subunit
MAAVRSARLLRGRAEVVLVSDSDTFIERIRLHEQAAARRDVGVPMTDLLRGTGVRFLRGRATGIDAEKRRVRVGESDVAFDHLVLALGSAVDRAGVPGINEHAFTMDHGSAARLAEALPAVAARGGRLVVCGGGLTGIEAATEFAEAHPALKVTLLTRGELGDFLSKRGQAYVKGAFKRLGIEVIEGRTARAIQAGEVMTEGGAVPFDLCVWAGGFRAAPLAREAGLAVNDRGQVLVDERLASRSHPSIYVAGDMAAPEGCAAPVLMACKTGLPMGKHVADNVAARVLGRPEAAFRFADVGLCLSLGRRDGLFQIASRDGTPRERVITGRLAAWVKEQVCRFTVRSLRAEAQSFLPYRWMKPRGRGADVGAIEEPGLLA